MYFWSIYRRLNHYKLSFKKWTFSWRKLRPILSSTRHVSRHDKTHLSHFFLSFFVVFPPYRLSRHDKKDKNVKIKKSMKSFKMKKRIFHFETITVALFFPKVEIDQKNNFSYFFWQLDVLICLTPRQCKIMYFLYLLAVIN